MTLSQQNAISMAELFVYIPALTIAIFLCFRHGFCRSTGWIYIIFLSLARIVGASLQLATISDPSNLNLHVGFAILVNIGLSPLLLIQLGLLSRVLTSIRKSAKTILNERLVRLVQLLVLIGLILTTVGGSRSGISYAKTGVYDVSSLSTSGMGLMITGFVLIVLVWIQVVLQISDAEPGERRLAFAVGFSMPFILVRLIYAAASVFGNSAKFRAVGGSVNIQLGMVVIMEMIATFIVEGFGLTQRRLDEHQNDDDVGVKARRSGEDRNYQLLCIE